ncbi:MAG: GH3 auxin-responsive promoter family protein [Dehalococcoidales bacterium]|nr:GH3 auxin-responsive promoter family protein [Dehalococcoidales bacterium]
MPISPGYYRELGTISAACALFASCKGRGDASGLDKGAKFIYAVAPRPYTSGTFAYIATEEVEGVSLPTLELAEKMSFEERLAMSFNQALSGGFDYYFGVSVALIAIGEKINEQMKHIDIKALLSHPKALVRSLRGIIRSKIAKRPLLPKDLWDVKGIIGGGTDCNIYRDFVKTTWGKTPLNIYVSTEAGIAATQVWDKRDMIFVPNLNFLEFIPESEYTRWQLDHSYIPHSVLLDEVQAGSKYELVITNFHGGAMVRYRTGDVIKITSLRNDKLGIELPQMEFDGRIDDTLDIGGFVRLNEKVIWQAISNTGIPYTDWAARKEMEGTVSLLHLFIELKDECTLDEGAIAKAIYLELKRMDEDFMYGDIESILNTMPIKVTSLQKGAFNHYINVRQAQGADLAHLKPRHINPSDKELSILGTPMPSDQKPVTQPVGVPTVN